MIPSAFAASPVLKQVTIGNRMNIILRTKTPRDLVAGAGTGAKPSGLAEGVGDVATVTATRLFDRTGTLFALLCGRIVEFKPMTLIRFERFSLEPNTQRFYEENKGRN
jgi:hypothetical protein